MRHFLSAWVVWTIADRVNAFYANENGIPFILFRFTQIENEIFTDDNKVFMLCFLINIGISVENNSFQKFSCSQRFQLFSQMPIQSV